MLIVAGLLGLLFTSPEPVRIVTLQDGAATAVPRIPWASACALLALVTGLGFVIAARFVKTERTGGRTTHRSIHLPAKGSPRPPA